MQQVRKSIDNYLGSCLTLNEVQERIKYMHQYLMESAKAYENSNQSNQVQQEPGTLEEPNQQAE